MVRSSALCREVSIRPAGDLASLASPSMAAGIEGLVQPPGDNAAEAPEVSLSMQHPILTPIDGGSVTSAEPWEATFEADLAVMLRRYLAENPPPAPSQLARDAENWASNLEHLGRARLAAAGARRLRSA
jgi:hypothetical protein